MDGEHKGKPYEQMDDLGGFPPIFGNTQIFSASMLVFGEPVTFQVCLGLMVTSEKGILEDGPPLRMGRGFV